MRKNINTECIVGRVYQHDLAIKTVQNQSSPNFGKEFIAGSLDIATDEEGMNVLTVHYTYVTETTKAGGKNSTYAALKKIIDDGKTWIADGKDVATKVKADTSLALNDFPSQDGTTMVSQKRNEGGFVTLINELPDLSERNTFSTDMVITSVAKVEVDETKHIDEPYVSVRGAVFNFRNAILPVEFVVRNPSGMKYFEDLDVTNANPVYTKVWGKIISTTTKTAITEDSAFGEAAVRMVERKTKEWVITGTAKMPYEFGEEGVLTAEELTKAMKDREVYLADVKKRADDYRASKAATTPSAFPSTGAITASKGTFNF
jgi:hypothetical protein